MNHSISSINSDQQIDDLKTHIKQVVRQSRESLINLSNYDEEIACAAAANKLSLMKQQLVSKHDIVFTAKQTQNANGSKKRGATQMSKANNNNGA